MYIRIYIYMYIYNIFIPLVYVFYFICLKKHSFQIAMLSVCVCLSPFHLSKELISFYKARLESNAIKFLSIAVLRHFLQSEITT
jgi:hypothetical protein